MFSKKYDLIVIGGGHAGCEAAAASASLGSKTLLITMNIQTIGQMSCNPAMGGIAKGQIVREIDALGGLSGIVSDASTIQFRMLNRSKGPAMWSPRSQNDRMLFAAEWRTELEKKKNLDFYQEMASSLLVKNGKICGVKTSLGIEILSDAIVLTNGTFLNGIIHIGENQFRGGRAAERSSIGITEQLISLGFISGRMKTGTPPRIDGRSVDFNKMEEQKGDLDRKTFSFLNKMNDLEQKSCFITYTNPCVHEEIEKGMSRSPMFLGTIKSTGPRYCPSIEDKIRRFSDKSRHQLFLEPEGVQTIEMYLNGFPTSLPHEVQAKAIQFIPGLENAKLFRPGYAIEYDYFPPIQLRKSLETKLIRGLFFAGQINGTTGYEEAACQGLVAGINASKKFLNKEKFILSRSESYIGVLIDDLVTKGTDEPYRMFTSRAEHRLLLRQDNADERLTEKGYSIGLSSKERLNRIRKKQKAISLIQSRVEKISIRPEDVNSLLEKCNSSSLKHSQKLKTLLKRPNISFAELKKIPSVCALIENQPQEILEQLEIRVKYEGYIAREKQMVDKMNRLDSLKIPESINYDVISSLSIEAREKLKKIQPTSISQASRISGVSPADISVLLVQMGR